jgi:hypothetical protein
LESTEPFNSRFGLCAEPLPVGETGVSKGKDEGGEGDHPFCTEPKAEEERGDDT